MAKSQTLDSPKNPQNLKWVKYTKMCVLEYLKANTIDEKMKGSVAPSVLLATDASKSHTHFKNNFKEHKL